MLRGKPRGCSRAAAIRGSNHHSRSARSTCSFAALVLLSTVGLRGFGHDRRSGVTTLHVARTRTDHSRGCATLQTQPGSQCRQSRNQHGDNNFNNLLLVHRNLKFKISNAELACKIRLHVFLRYGVAKERRVLRLGSEACLQRRALGGIGQGRFSGLHRGLQRILRQDVLRMIGLRRVQQVNT